MNNPRPKKLTEQQEGQILIAEQLHIRADIFVAGVAARLKGECCGGSRYQLEECARVLTEASRMHQQAYAIHDEATANLRSKP